MKLHLIVCRSGEVSTVKTAVKTIIIRTEDLDALIQIHRKKCYVTLMEKVLKFVEVCSPTTISVFEEPTENVW